jgi:hypothetical protein
VRARGSWADLVARDDLREAYLDLTVETAGPDPGLADRVRDEFDFVVKVQADYPRAVEEGGDRPLRSLDELFADYILERDGAPADSTLLDAFREIMELADAPA